MHTEILLPANAPGEYADRAALWNAVEKIEKAKNAQLAREIQIALPVEFTLEQADIYFKHRGKKTLSEADEILFTTATTYLKSVMNGQPTLPVKAWKSEYAKLSAEHKTLNQRYVFLKDAVKEAEQVRKSVYSILRQEQREQRPRT